MHTSLDKPLTLLEYLKASFPDSSTTQLKKWLAQGRIEVNKTIVKSPIYALKEGESVHLLKKQKLSKEPFEIIYEDNSFVVVNKPSGLLSVALDNQSENNLHALLKQRYPRKRIGVIHRLDRDTSGAILFSLDQDSYLSLKEQLKKRSMKRKYLVLIEGILEGEGVWDSFLKEDSSFTVHTVSEKTEGAEHAITEWKALGHDQKSTLLECRLVTGRKNQIRVQAQAVGHPVVGDTKYGSTKIGSSHRLMLHAFSLTCSHPDTEELLHFYAPVPDSFLKGLSKGIQQHAFANFSKQQKEKS